MLDLFRQFSGSFVTRILLLLLIASFGLWGVGDMVGRMGVHRVIATVGERTISFEQFARQLAEEQARLRSQLGASYSEAMLEQLHVPEFVLRRMIQSLLLEQEALRLGMVPDDRYLVENIRNNPVFTNESNAFDKQRFEMMLRNQGMSESSYVERLRMQLASDALMDAITVSLPLNDDLFATMQAAYAQGRDITLYRLSDASIGAIPEPVEAALKEFQKTHADRFTRPEMRKVSFLQFSATGLKLVAASVTDDAVKAYYDAHPDQFQRPEKREVEQLLYSDEAQARAAYVQWKSGKTFAQVAEITKPLNEKNISLGLVDPKTMMTAESQVVFSLREAEVTEPVQSPFGWHLFRVVRIVPAGLQPLEEVRGTIRKNLEQEGSEEAVRERLNQLEDALAGGSSLEEVAESLGKLKITSIAAFDKHANGEDGKPLSAFPELDHFLETAFKTDEKQASSVTAAGNGNYFILRVDAVMPEALKPFAEVKDSVRQGYLDERTAQLRAEVVAKIEAEMSKGVAFTEIVKKYALVVAGKGPLHRRSIGLAGQGVPPALLQKIFAAQIGEVTLPVRRQDGLYFLASVDAVSQTTYPEIGAKLQKKDVLQKMQEEMLGQYMRLLESRTPVEIHKDALEQIMQRMDDHAS